MADDKKKEKYAIVDSDEEIGDSDEEGTKVVYETQTQLTPGHPDYDHYYNNGGAGGQGGIAGSVSGDTGHTSLMASVEVPEAEGQPDHAALAAEAHAEKTRQNLALCLQYTDEGAKLRQATSELQDTLKDFKERKEELDKTRKDFNERTANQKRKLDDKEAKLGPMLEQAEADLEANKAAKKKLKEDVAKLGASIMGEEDEPEDD
jgi:hypothetical protein